MKLKFARFKFTHILCAAFALSIVTPAVQADDVYQFVIKKQEEKRKWRWSLSEWLDTRDRMRLMDLWLALHSSEPYEFFIGGSYASGDKVNGAGKFTGGAGELAAYASIFGLQIIRESEADERVSALMNIRIFGFHAQSTNITLEGGFRSTNTFDGDFKNGLFGIKMQLAINKFFGVEGLYRKYFSAYDQSSPAIGYAGNRIEYGPFIDFSFFRISGGLFDESESRKGFRVGAKLYF